MATFLRLLKDRVVQSESGRLQHCYKCHTRGGEANNPSVAQFAARLFGEKFDVADVIGAEREEIPGTEG